MHPLVLTISIILSCIFTHVQSYVLIETLDVLITECCIIMAIHV